MNGRCVSLNMNCQMADVVEEHRGRHSVQFCGQSPNLDYYNYCSSFIIPPGTFALPKTPNGLALQILMKPAGAHLRSRQCKYLQSCRTIVFESGGFTGILLDPRSSNSVWQYWNLVNLGLAGGHQASGTYMFMALDSRGEDLPELFTVFILCTAHQMPYPISRLRDTIYYMLNAKCCTI